MTLPTARKTSTAKANAIATSPTRPPERVSRHQAEKSKSPAGSRMTAAARTTRSQTPASLPAQIAPLEIGREK